MSLIEVLVAIFVMGLGMIALLTLFPIGAISMGQAIQYDRATVCAGNAAAADRIWSIGLDPQVHKDFLDPSESGHAAGTPQIPPNGGPGYPVFVDDWGYNAIAGSLNGALPATPVPPTSPSFWVGGMDGVTVNPNFGAAPPYGIRRQSTSFLNNSSAGGDPALSTGILVGPFGPLTGPAYRTNKILSWSFLLDDMTFLSDGISSGLPCPPPGIGAVQREDRYSWAYFYRPPQIATGSVVDAQIDLNVVVYNGRTPGFSATGAPLGEQTFLALFDTNSNPNRIRLTWGSAPPNVRKGSWVLDATIVYDATKNPTEIHGYFYRVTGVTQSGPTSVDLTIQGILRGFNTPASFTTTGANNPGYVVVMDNVVDVFERLTNSQGVQ
jgi:hypothetical protein